MTCDEFEKTYRRRLKKYARRLTQELSLPAHMREDLYQACWLVVARQLKSWNPEGGMSAFNWCASTMKREMTAEFRRYHGNKAYGWRREIHYFQQPIGEREGVAEHVNLDLKIDIERLLKKEGINRNTERYLRHAIIGEHGAEMAQEDGQTRQAVNNALRITRKRLQKILEDYANDRPSELPESRRSLAWLADFRGGDNVHEQMSPNKACSKW